MAVLAKTKVCEVQVYRNSVTVTRNGEVRLNAGKNILYVAGMTESARKDSFRLKFPEGIRAVNIQIVSMEELDADTHVCDNEDGTIQAPVRESKRIQRELDEIEYQLGTCTMLMELRKTNGDFSNRTDVSVEAQEQYMEALPKQLMALHTQMKELEERQEKLQKELEKELKAEGKPMIMAELVSENAGDFPFVLQYQESAGSWHPKYEVHFTGEKEPLSVCMKAQIFQSSGEDWKQVKVTLYTGNPSVSHDLPTMPSVQLSLYEPPKAKAVMRSNAVMMEDACMMEAAAAPMMGMAMKTLQMTEAAVSEEETMTAFVLPDLRDILTDTNGNIADLRAFTVKAGYHVLCIPKVNDKCFLTAEIVTSEWPLPPANAAIYLQDTYAGEIYVNANADTDLFTLSLGQDERVNVIRTELPKKTQDVFMKGQKKQICATKIRLVNNASDKVKLLIKDQIPVSTDKSVIVEARELSEGSVSEETGEVLWELEAEPDHTIELGLSYSITWPKEKRLTENKRFISVKSRICPNCGRPVAGKFCPECGSAVE